MLKSAISGKILRNSHSLVVDELGKAIVGGVYPSGMLLPGDAELVERFAVSRTVLREAMKTLSAKGLIVARARIGTRVTERARWNLFDADVLSWHLESGVDDAFLDHLCDMRLCFEPFAVRLAARHATKEDIDKLYEYAAAMHAAASMEDFATADLALHMTLLGASKNPFMYSVGSLIEAGLVNVFRMSSPTGDPARQADNANRHRRIVDAIRAGDAEMAARAVETVILEGRERAAGAVASAR